MAIQRAAIIKDALDKAFPELSLAARTALSTAIVRFVDRAKIKRLDLTRDLELGAAHLDRTTELSRTLRTLRERANRQPEEVAKTCEWSLSKLTRIEAGDVGVSATDVAFLLGIYRIKDPLRANVLELARRDRDNRRQRSA